MRSLHSQSASVDLAAGATVLSHTVTTATALADLILEVGDGTSNLAAAAETTLTVAITVAGVPIRGSDPTETVEVGRTRLRIPVDTFPVALGETVAVTLTSDQPGDTAVAVTATLRDASPLQPVTRGRQVKADADGLVELSTESTEMVATAVSSSAVVVLPSSATAQDRVKGTTITAFTDELLVVPLVVRDADCNAVDLSTKTLVFVVTESDGTLVDSIPDGDITISGDDSNTATLTLTADMVATAGQYKWALRVATTNAVLGHGDFVVRFAANT